MTGNLKDYIKKSKGLNDGWSSAAVEGSELRSPYGLPPFTPFHGLWPYMGCGPIWGVCYIKCAFIIVVSGNL
jgi:hypothetical protein